MIYHKNETLILENRVNDTKPKTLYNDTGKYSAVNNPSVIELLQRAHTFFW